MAKINRVTIEVYENIFGYSRAGATHRINNLRKSLGLQIGDILTVTKFCEYEKITLAEFDTLVERSKTKTTT